MLAGRVGAAMSAEIGTMKVTEQIDALRALAVYPVDYLVVPRAVAMCVSVPLLVGECVFFGVVASYYVGVVVLGIQGAYYLENMTKYMLPRDIYMALIKAAVFGVIIIFVSCYEGLNASEGAVGVGRATTESVVIASLGHPDLEFFPDDASQRDLSRGKLVNTHGQRFWRSAVWSNASADTRSCVAST